MALGEFELALRVAAGLFVVVAPTLLFLGLWRGLMRLRDEHLIERVRRMERHRVTSPSSGGVAAPAVASLADGERVVCDVCGTENLAGTTFCRECLGTLPVE